LSSLEDRQHELQSRISQIDSDIAQLDAQFLALAAEFNSADGNASLRSAEQIEQKLMQLRREKAMSIAAQAHVTKQQLDEKALQADKDRRAFQAERQKHVDAVTTLSHECDEFLQKLRELLDRRASHLHSLGMLGANGAILAKLGKPALTRAACFHGLAKFFALERVAATSLLALGSTSTLVAGLGREAAPLASSPLSEPGAADCPPAAAPAPTTNGGEDDRATRDDHPTNGGEPARRRRRIFGGGPDDD
jgi:hypothetical protein